MAGFNSSTRAAEQGIERLRTAADGAGRQLARQAELAQALKDDLHFLIERGEQIADRLDSAVRAGRSLAQENVVHEAVAPGPAAGMPPDAVNTAGTSGARPADPAPDEAAPRARSQAERELLKALRMAR